MNFLAGTRLYVVTRLAGLVVTAALFVLVSRKVDVQTLGKALAGMSPACFLLALVVYGLALLIAGLRWHLSLRLTDSAVHPGASCRLSFIGHFFFVILFGAAGGDIGKSILYSRWYRFGFPEVVASSPLDRSLGTIGSITVAGAAFGLAFGAGGFHEWQPVEWAFVQSWWAVVVLLAVGVGAVLLLWRPHEETPVMRGWRSFRSGVGRLFQMPVLGRKAIVVSMAHQVATYSVFALCLQAIAREPLPWLELAWTIPAITILSCFPITIAGAGVREVASVTLLGLYGIPAGDAVAAAMITLAVKLIWAVMGGLILWRESHRQQACAARAEPQSISVVIPTRNEAESLPVTLSQVQSMPEVSEVIVVDGGSSDNTMAVARSLNCRVLECSASRGAQLRLGASKATGDAVLLLHADTWLPEHAGRELLHCLRDRTVVAGGFWKVFEDSPFLLLGSRFKCAIRLWGYRRIAGDQAMFVRRDVLESIGGVPDVPLMEEFELCRELRRMGRLALAGATVRTSSRRFREHGVLRTYLLMGRIHALYRAGTPLEELRKRYDNAGASK